MIQAPRTLLLEVEPPRIEGVPMTFLREWRHEPRRKGWPPDWPSVEMVLFKGRRNLDPAILPANLRSGPPPFRAEYCLQLRLDGDRTVYAYRLFQHDTVTWCSGDDPGEFEIVDMLEVGDAPTLGGPPRWKPEDAIWPRRDGALMWFHSQTHVKDSADCIYLFICRDAGGVLQFAIFTQDQSAQTSEEHYRLEELIWAFADNPADASVIERCVVEGDRFLHQALVEHDLATAPLLERLASEGRNAEIRKRAARRLQDLP